MQEIVKCKTSIAKKMPGAPHEILLVLDGTTGLNMLNQVCAASSLPCPHKVPRALGL
jgi:signal recognition particle GTPase